MFMRKTRLTLGARDVWGLPEWRLGELKMQNTFQSIMGVPAGQFPCSGTANVSSLFRVPFSPQPVRMHLAVGQIHICEADSNTLNNSEMYKTT